MATPLGPPNAPHHQTTLL